ncbi:MAG: hypothetical protein HC915_18900 [Anaerolineae bacterium]|nr:hypothetical protein [Anaerolineae bacterium]
MTIPRETLAALPKIELHRHLEGAVRLHTLVEIAREAGVQMPEYEVETLRPFVQIMDGQPRSSRNFLDKFSTIRQFFRTPAIVDRVTREVVADAAADQIKYMELRFTPKALCSMSQCSLHEVVTVVCRAASEAAAAPVLFLITFSSISARLSTATIPHNQRRFCRFCGMAGIVAPGAGSRKGPGDALEQAQVLGTGANGFVQGFDFGDDGADPALVLGQGTDRLCMGTGGLGQAGAAGGAWQQALQQVEEVLHGFGLFAGAPHRERQVAHPQDGPAIGALVVDVLAPIAHHTDGRVNQQKVLQVVGQLLLDHV